MFCSSCSLQLLLVVRLIYQYCSVYLLCVVIPLGLLHLFTSLFSIALFAVCQVYRLHCVSKKQLCCRREAARCFVHLCSTTVQYLKHSLILPAGLCEAQPCRYCSYSMVQKWVFRPAEATRCPDKRKIWQRTAGPPLRPRPVPNFIGAKMQEHSPQNCQNFEFWQ